MFKFLSFSQTLDIPIPNDTQVGSSTENDSGKQKMNLAEIIDVVGSPGTPNSTHIN